MNCSDFEHIVFPYLDGDLRQDERASADAHFGVCAQCSGKLAEARAFFLTLKEARLPDPTPAYWGSVLPRIHMALERKQRFSVTKLLFRTVFPATASVAAILIGVLLLPLRHDVSTEDLTARLRQTVPEEIQLLEEQFSFTVAANPLAPRELADLHASDDREQILTIFHGNEPALSTLEDEHLRAFDGLSDKELGQLLAVADNVSF
jgi:hypothetical protein